MARKAAAEGLVVIDDPESILRCSNKVYLAEVLARHKIPAPRTVIAHIKTIDHILEELSLPCVLKQPDSAFSQGVVLAKTAAALNQEVRRLLAKSDLVIAQEYLPSEFDWRVGILDRRPLFVCKYFMAEEDQDQYVAMKGRRQQGYSDIYEHRLTRRDGLRLWVLASASPLYDASGRYLGALGMDTCTKNFMG